MGPPWATGGGLILVVAGILSLVFFPAGLIVIGLAAVALVVAIVVGGGDAADYEGTPPDKVTGGPRWWQKRWDE